MIELITFLALCWAGFAAIGAMLDGEWDWPMTWVLIGVAFVAYLVIR